ncbi:MAG: N-acetyltransferase [Desulfobacterales bacterium]|nr:N-acetyltransferase [Desulfobacterales bacterium]
MTLEIRQTTPGDLNDILQVQKAAFGNIKEAELTQDLLNDPTAEPRLSLLAEKDGEVVGHILFTAVHIPESDLACSILAPLAVVPKAQDQGVGGKLIGAGLDALKASGVHLVFVLGHPSYYPKFGFIPVRPLAIDAPYPIPHEHWDAWMFQALNQAPLSSVASTLVVSDALSRPQHWQE